MRPKNVSVELSESGNHRSRFQAGSLECNSYRFPPLHLKKCFDVILTTFPGMDTTEAGKVENGPWMNWFCTRTIPTLFGVQFLSFLVNTIENCFGRIWMTFPGLDPTGADELQNRSRMTLFCTRNIATQFGM